MRSGAIFRGLNASHWNCSICSYVFSRHWHKISLFISYHPSSECKFSQQRAPPVLFQCLGEGNGTHFSGLAWRIPETEEPGGLPSMGSNRVGHDRSDLAAAAGGARHIVSSQYALGKWANILCKWAKSKSFPCNFQMVKVLLLLAMFSEVSSLIFFY